jgi:pantoate--beta-alanine ligase
MSQVISTYLEWQEIRGRLSGCVGFVPTMGALHEGHASLFRRAKHECEIVVASIFVNPTQFNNREDFEKYPNRLEQDLECLRREQVDYLILPQYSELYADDYTFQVHETEFSRQMEGAHRPGHFDGVLTVVLKLLNWVNPQRAYFGEKDYQQYKLIQNMCAALFLNIDVIGCPTVREASGLALSSRNLRLSDHERNAIAPQLYQALATAYSAGEAQLNLEIAGFRVDYVEDVEGRRFAAAFLGDVRLIDNIALPSIQSAVEISL